MEAGAVRQMIDSGAVGGDGILDAGDGYHVGWQGGIGAAAGDHDMDAPGDGVLQRRAVCRGEPPLTVQRGLVQIQCDTLDFHNIAS